MVKLNISKRDILPSCGHTLMGGVQYVRNDIFAQPLASAVNLSIYLSDCVLTCCLKHCFQTFKSQCNEQICANIVVNRNKILQQNWFRLSTVKDK